MRRWMFAGLLALLGCSGGRDDDDHDDHDGEVPSDDATLLDNQGLAPLLSAPTDDCEAR